SSGSASRMEALHLSSGAAASMTAQALTCLRGNCPAPTNQGRKKTMGRSRFMITTAAVLAAGLTLTACGAENTGGGDDTSEGGGGETEAAGGGGEADWGSCEMTEGVEPMPDPEGTGEDETELEIGVAAGWSDSIAVSH